MEAEAFPLDMDIARQVAEPWQPVGNDTSTPTITMTMPRYMRVLPNPAIIPISNRTVS